MSAIKDSIIGRMRAKLAARPDSEHEQAFIRLGVGLVLFFYLLPRAFVRSGESHETDILFLAAMFAFLALAAAIIVGILLYPGESRVRRVLGALIDSTATSFFMIVASDHAAPLFMMYLWITLANGYRYGVPYLLSTLGLSVAGFCVVLWLSPFWHEYLGVGIGFLIGMVVLSLYVLTLVKRMFNALSRAEAANLAKRRFISVVSHEIRTPLNAIIGMADLLRETPLNRDQGEMLHTLGGSSRVLLGLVEDVLDFSKIEAGKLVIENVDFDLHALVNSTVKILGAQAEQKKLDLTTSIMPEVPPALKGDPHHLRQILINLVGNAIKFTEKGSVAVHVSMIEDAEQEVKLKFSVRDTGIGIPAEAQRRIFESFTQADETTTRRFGGTGLGTTIAKQLVDLMGGRMGLESAVGLGSTFWLEIRFGRQPLAQAEQVIGHLAGSRIYMVGFQDVEADLLSNMLSGWGASALTAPSADAAAIRIDAETGVLPRVHSVIVKSETTAAARADLARLRRNPGPEIPAILVSTRGSGVDAGAMVAIGYRTVFEWPLEKSLLFNTLHAAHAGEDEKRDVVFLSEYLRRREGRSVHVLVADDNAANRMVISKLLERAGHSVDLVHHGEQVLDAVETRPYDLIIVDRNMPEMGGVDAVRALRVMEQGRLRTPVIVMSADVTLDARTESIRAGADAFLPKPIEARKLLDAIGELCGGADAKPESNARREVSSQATPSVAVLNYETIGLLEELGSGSDFMQKLIQGFIEDNQQIVGRLEPAAPGRQASAELRNLLHAMKGSASSMGADRLTHSCARALRLPDADLRSQAAQIVRTIREDFEAVRKALAEYQSRVRRGAG